LDVLTEFLGQENGHMGKIVDIEVSDRAVTV
jgi:hypothetical protein